MRIIIKISSILIVLLFFSCKDDITITNSDAYFVSVDGNDDASGKEDAPWRTIQKAAKTLVAGDTVFIKAGTYNERVQFEISGNEDNYIVFTNYKDDVVKVDGTNISWDGTWNGLVNISENNYIEISGITVMNVNRHAGIFVEDANHIILKNNKTYNTFSSGIGVWTCNDIIIEGNEVELACNGGEQESISVSNTYNCSIFRNNVHNNGNGDGGGEGIDVKQGSHDVLIYENWVHNLNNRVGIYVDAWDKTTYNVKVYQNKVNNCTESGFVVASEFGGELSEVEIFNNISYNNKYDGIQVGGWKNEDYTGDATPVKNILIINNTCYNNGSIDDGFGFGITVDNAYAEDITIRNNICYNNSSQIEVKNILSGKQIDHNLIYGYNETEFAEFGTDSIIANPQFMNEASFDFSLNSISPAIDKGSSERAPNTDYDGNSRPVGAGIDIGAFEFNGN